MKKWLKTFRKHKLSRINSVSFQLSKYKWFEFQCGRFDDDCTNALDIGIRSYRKTDHAGVELTILIMRWHVEFRIYDIRHWDSANECFEDERVPLKSWLIEGAKVGPIKIVLDHEIKRISEEMSNLLDLTEEDEILEELPAIEVKRLGDRLEGCLSSLLDLRQKDFSHVKQPQEEIV